MKCTHNDYYYITFCSLKRSYVLESYPLSLINLATCSRRWQSLRFKTPKILSLQKMWKHHTFMFVVVLNLHNAYMFDSYKWTHQYFGYNVDIYWENVNCGNSHYFMLKHSYIYVISCGWWASYQIRKNCRLRMRRERFPPPPISKKTAS